MDSKSHLRNNKPKDGNGRISRRSRWEGIPYGTVMRLDGRLVAQACLSANRHMSALFYAELYADHRLGGPLKALGTISEESQPLCCDNYASTNDISGFRSLTERQDNHHDETVPAMEITEYLTVLRDGLASLSEKESARAVGSIQTSFLLRQGYDSPLIGRDADCDDDVLVQLQQIEYSSNNLLQSPGPAAVSVSRCLESLGLIGTVQAFIRGMSLNGIHETMPSESGVLRENWFESSLYRMSWDNSIFVTEPSVGQAQYISTPPEITSPGCTGPGVHENFARSIDFFSQGDLGQSLASLDSVRRLLIPRLSVIANQEVPLDKLRWSLDRLGSVNLVESVLARSEKLEECLRVLEWNFGSSERVSSSPHGRFGLCVTELLIRSLYKRESRQRGEPATSSISKHLSSHLWRQSTLFCHQGLHEVAAGALQRLFAVANASPSTGFDASKLRLQESCILEARGDFTGAVRQLGQVIRILRSDGSAQRPILAEALITCGQWMAKYKVHPGSSILENYLEPGSIAARKVPLVYALFALVYPVRGFSAGCCWRCYSRSRANSLVSVCPAVESVDVPHRS